MDCFSSILRAVHNRIVVDGQDRRSKYAKAFEIDDRQKRKAKTLKKKQKCYFLLECFSSHFLPLSSLPSSRSLPSLRFSFLLVSSLAVQLCSLASFSSSLHSLRLTLIPVAKKYSSPFISCNAAFIAFSSAPFSPPYIHPKSSC